MKLELSKRMKANKDNRIIIVSYSTAISFLLMSGCLWRRSLANKYGVVPETVISDVKFRKLSSKLTRILNDKVKKCI